MSAVQDLTNLIASTAPTTRMLVIAAVVVAGFVLFLLALVAERCGVGRARFRHRNRPATAAEGRAAVDAEMARHFGTPHRAVQAVPARREVGSAA